MDQGYLGAYIDIINNYIIENYDYAVGLSKKNNRNNRILSFFQLKIKNDVEIILQNDYIDGCTEIYLLKQLLNQINLNVADNQLENIIKNIYLKCIDCIYNSPFLYYEKKESNINCAEEMFRNTIQYCLNL